MNDEIKMFYDFAQGRIDYYNPSDKDMLFEIVNNIRRLISFEKPDMVLPLEDKIMMIEHFQFDASQFKKGKGNLDKALRSQRNRDFDAFIANADYSEEPLTLTAEVGCNFKAEYYMDNLERVFNEHLAKIETYKQRLIEHNFVKNEQSIITAFLIIDTTPLGNYQMIDSWPEPFSIFQLKKFNIMLCEAEQLDYVFNGFFDGKKNRISFMSNTLESRAVFKDEFIDFDKDEYFSYEPLETRYFAMIDDPGNK
jgi:hypothetical protein